MNTLFPLPERNETRLERAKREHCIWTHYCYTYDPEDTWMAVKFDNAEELAEPLKTYSSNCRIYAESGRTAGGKTEAEAVINLGKQCGLKITL